MTKKNNSRGWHRESRRHALARRGIKTRCLVAKGMIKDIVEFPKGVEVDYRNPRHWMTLFWVSSLNNNFSNFDFDRVFDISERVMYEKLRAHALVSAEDTLNYFRELEETGDVSYLLFVQSPMSRMWSTFMEKKDSLEKVVGEQDAQWLNENPTKPMPEHMALKLANNIHETARDIFAEESPYREMVETYKMLQDRPERLEDRVFLVDKIIDTYHVGGSIWRFDVEAHRKQVENLYKRFGETHISDLGVQRKRVDYEGGYS